MRGEGCLEYPGSGRRVVSPLPLGRFRLGFSVVTIVSRGLVIRAIGSGDFRHRPHLSHPIRHFPKRSQRTGGYGIALSTILNLIFINVHHDRDIVSWCQLTGPLH